jgi:hypothetical protein
VRLGSNHGPLRIRCETNARCRVRDGDRLDWFSRVAGQIASQAGQLLVSARGVGKPDALAELLEDRHRPGLGVFAHLQHRTVGSAGHLRSRHDERLASADEWPWLAQHTGRYAGSVPAAPWPCSFTEARSYPVARISPAGRAEG